MIKASDEHLYMCPSCGAILTGNVWSRRKSADNLSYYCERCDTKLHPENLREIHN